MGRLSTHVLDTARGAPAEGLRIELYRCEPGGQRSLVKSSITDADGRVGDPLLAGDELERGLWELVFHAGDYLRGMEAPLPDPPFLDEITVRFGVADPQANYHVPLLLSPYGYSTYRGS